MIQTHASRHRYPLRSFWADLARTVTGLILTAGPLFLGDIFLVVRIILIVLVFVFFIYGLRTIARRALTVELSDQGIRAYGPIARTVDWANLKDFRLNFYSTRRDHETGWMQLRLSDGRNKIHLDDSIEGFDLIVRESVRAAQIQNISLGASTVENLITLGIGQRDISSASAPEAAPGL